MKNIASNSIGDINETQQDKGNLSIIILFFMFVALLIGDFLSKISTSLFIPFDNGSKLFPLIAIAMLMGFMRVKMNFYWWAATGLYVLYLLYGVLVSYLHNKGLKLIAVQFYHEIKFFPMIAVCGLCQADKRWFDISKKIVTGIAFVSVPLVIFQFVAPSVYTAIFPDGGHINMADLGSLVIQRGAGYFWHGANLAMFATSAFVMIAALYRRGLIEKCMLELTVLTLLLLLTIQRFEWVLHGLVVLILLMRRYLDFDFRPYLTYVFMGMFLIFFFYVIADSNNYWALYENFYNERAEFLFHAFWELDASNYLGAGWGTIGSHTAKDIADVYQYNGMKDLWWVREDKAYFYDTYWPHVIGETGVPGVLFLVLSMTMLLRALRSPEAVLIAFVFFLGSAFSSCTQNLLFLVINGWFICILENLERLYGSKGNQTHNLEKT